MFEKDPTLREAIERETSKYKTEIKEYQKLVDQLNKIPEMRLEIEATSSLAYLIESFKKKNPANWQEDLAKLREKITEINTKEGKLGVNLFLGEKIGKTYIQQLEKEKEATKDEEMKRKLSIMIQMQEDHLVFARQTYKKKKPVGFGGISKDYVPKWYWVWYVSEKREK